jgi:thiol-disulfide isomerase/thioredoxin
MNRRLSVLFGVLLVVLFVLTLQITKEPSIQRQKVSQSSLQPWIDFELPTTSGTTWSSTSINNQAVILNFWAPWCLPCRDEVPYLIELQVRYGSDFKFIGIAIDQFSNVQKFEDEFGLNYLSLVDDTKGMELLQYYEESSTLPLTLVFDRDRNLKHRVLGSFNPKSFEQVLKEML